MQLSSVSINSHNEEYCDKQGWNPLINFVPAERNFVNHRICFSWIRPGHPLLGSSFTFTFVPCYANELFKRLFHEDRLDIHFDALKRCSRVLGRKFSSICKRFSCPCRSLQLLDWCSWRESLFPPTPELQLCNISVQLPHFLKSPKSKAVFKKGVVLDVRYRKRGVGGHNLGQKKLPLASIWFRSFESIIQIFKDRLTSWHCVQTLWADLNFGSKL